MSLSKRQPCAQVNLAKCKHSPLIWTEAVPEPSVLTFPICELDCINRERDGSPRSPMCLSSSEGAPWFFLWGLKWGPAEVHPLLSVNGVQRSTLSCPLTCCLRTRCNVSTAQEGKRRKTYWTWKPRSALAERFLIYMSVCILT